MRISILVRLGLSFLALIFFSFILGYKGFVYISDLDDENVKMYEHPFAVTKHSRDIHVKILELTEKLRNALLAQDIDSILMIDAECDAAFEEIDKHSASIDRLILGDRISYASFLATYEDLKIAEKKFFGFLKLDEKEKAHKAFYKKFLKYKQRITFNLTAIEEHADSKAKLSHDKSVMYAKDAIREYTILLLIITGLGALFSFFSSIHFIRPIRDLRKIIEAIAIGDTSSVIKGLNRKDELGDISRAIALLNTHIEHITTHANAVSNGNYTLVLEQRSKKDTLIQSMQLMTENLHSISVENTKTNWLQNGQMHLSEILREDESLDELSNNVLKAIVEHTSAQVAGLYLVEDKNLTLSASFAFDSSKVHQIEFAFGEGIIGQAALDDKLLVMHSLPDDYIAIKSGVGEKIADTLILLPFSSHSEVLGVIELAYFGDVSSDVLEFLESLKESLAISYENINSKIRLNDSLIQEQASSEELQVQEEELRVSNERLREQSTVLEEQKDDLLKKATELENSSRYKSEFLANMSHELRTPLNSLLILSRSLADNDENHLSEDEVESATVIKESGEHLLSLINDILDISKIEAGQMHVSQDEVSTQELVSSMNKRFIHMAKDKNIEFMGSIDTDVPSYFMSDRTKLGQIISNLISNAIKFTKKGEVTFFVKRENEYLVLRVKDTGIGIPLNKQELIFEAFKQADGSTSRNFGGTGLGLSIALKFSELLDGHIKVESEEGKGSIFTLTIPLREEEHVEQELVERRFEETLPPFADDRESIDSSKHLFLIIEDDDKFSKILYDTCVGQGNQAIVASDGETGIVLAKKFKVSGIILDYMLPGLDGSDILALLKGDELTKDIPVHVISALDNLMDMKQLGAVGQLVKPTSNKEIVNVLKTFKTFDKKKELDEVGLFTSHIKSKSPQSPKKINDTLVDLSGKSMLLVDDDMRNIFSLAKVFRAKGVNVHVASNGKKALEILGEFSDIDIILMDIMMPNMNGFEATEEIRKLELYKEVPIIAVTASAMEGDKEKCLNSGANDYMSKPIDIEKLLVMMQMWL